MVSLYYAHILRPTDTQHLGFHTKWHSITEDCMVTMLALGLLTEARNDVHVKLHENPPSTETVTGRNVQHTDTNANTGSFIKNEPISQYTSNAACHYKERSLTFRIVASRVLPPPVQPTQSDLPLTAFAAWVSEWQHLSKKCSVSLSWRAPIVWSQCNVQYRPSPVVPTVAGHRMWWWWSYWEGHIHVSWYYWLLGKYGLIKSVHSL
jgi:hypothetical protein